MMRRSLHMKLSLMMAVTILLLTFVIGAFLIRGVQAFYIGEFYAQMQAFFGDGEIARELRMAQADGDRTDYEMLADRLDAYSGRLGIVYGTRYYYILDGATGAYLDGSEEPEGGELRITPNVLLAMGGQDGDRSDRSNEYMDVALQVDTGDGNTYIVQIYDTGQTASDLSGSLYTIILSAAGIGLAISIVLSAVLSKTMVVPIQNLTRAAESVAAGDFKRIETSAHDEIGELGETFNDMAGQLEETMEKLERSNALQKEFVANVSHELRTPLTSVRSYSETLLDSDLPEDTRRELLQVVVSESDRMSRLISDLLTLSRLDAEQKKPRAEEFSFKASVDGILRMLRLTAEKKNLFMSFTCPDDLPRVTGDRPGIEQVVLNIVSNAVKYTQEGGRVELLAYSDGEKVFLEVRDNGPGIPEEDMPRIFERFYRVDKGRSRNLGGTGLGLAIARETARRCGGDIVLESTLGLGTLVTISLPLEVGGDED